MEFCLTQYGKGEEFTALFKEAFEYICRTTDQILTTQQNCSRNPDLVNDFFGLCTRYIRHNKQIFYESSTLEVLMKGVTINAIGLEQNDAVKEHSSFLIELTRDVFRDLNEGHQTEYTAK